MPMREWDDVRRLESVLTYRRVLSSVLALLVASASLTLVVTPASAGPLTADPESAAQDSEVTALASNPPHDVQLRRVGAQGFRIWWRTPDISGQSPIVGYTATLEPGGATCTLGFDESGMAIPNCSVIDTDLFEPGVEYRASVRAVNEAGYWSAWSAESTPLTFVVIPGAPQNVKVETSSPSHLRVIWTAPADSGGSPIVAYQAFADPQPGSCIAQARPDTNEYSCVISGAWGLELRSSYRATVYAHNVVGRSGPATSSMSAEIWDRPDRPTDVRVYQTRLGMLDVEWTPPTEDGGREIISYVATMEPSGDSCTTTGDETKCTIVNSLNPDAEYQVSVEAFNSGAGSGPTEPVGRLPSPSVPVDVVMEFTDSGAPQARWNAPLSDGGSPIVLYKVRVDGSNQVPESIRRRTWSLASRWQRSSPGLSRRSSVGRVREGTRLPM